MRAKFLCSTRKDFLRMIHDSGLIDLILRVVNIVPIILNIEKKYGTDDTYDEIKHKMLDWT